MPFQPGDRVGAYEILSTLGAGGMGVVYRARDGKLGREVAIKTLPEEVATDGERLARFEREARALAALNHVNVASVYGFEQAGAAHLLVMELVPGETLADWIARGPIAIERALPLFLQIAAGLEAAHAKGIIHRDLKPANIKIAADSGRAGATELKPGAVKILDFGLAKALAPAEQGAERAVGASHSPTLTLEATMRGELLGTAAYMSPEQAQGEPADARADIWAFGVCLYEALAGRRAFDGANLSFVLASVIKDDLDLTALPAATPAAVRRLLRRCLEKDRERRLHDIADARLEIEEAIAAPVAEQPAQAAAPAGRKWLSRLGIAVAGVALGVAGSLLVAAWRRPALPATSLARYVLTAPPNEVAGFTPTEDLAITRDGSSVFYVTGESGSTLLRVRRLDQLAGVPVEGVEPGVLHPFLSPDERWIGYYHFQGSGDFSLRAVPIGGGPSRTLCAARALGVSWGDADTIVLGSVDGPLRAVEPGGEPRDLLALAEGEISHRLPEFLPGSRAVLFAAVNGNDLARAAIHVLTLATGERKLLVSGATQPRYAASGHLLYVADAKLWAVPFDAERLELLGDPAPVLEGVTVSYLGAAKYAVSESGALVYIAGGGETPRNTLTWIDRAGGEEEAIAAPPHNYGNPRLSPDGTRIAVDALDGIDQEVWIWDLEGAAPTRLTFSPRRNWSPLWSPDGRAIFYGSEQEGGGFDVFRASADGAGEAVRLTEQRRYLRPVSVTPDGASLLAMSGAGPAGPWQLVKLDARAKGEPPTLLEAEGNVAHAELSSDGRWLAYSSAKFGESEVFVRPFPAFDRGRWQVSTGGGSRPMWARNGSEIFFVDPTQRLMGATVATRGDALVLGEPRVVVEKVLAPLYGRPYDVSLDGSRLLLIKASGSPSTADASGRIVLVQGWLDELRRLAPPGPRSRPAQKGSVR